MSKRVCSVLVLAWMPPCVAFGAQKPLTVLIAPTKHDIAPGETVTLKMFVRNNLTAAPPLTIDATAKYTDDDGNEQASSASFHLTVGRTVHVGIIRLTIPDPLVYVPGTAAANGQPLAATPSGQRLSVQLDADIPEQQTVLVTLDVIRPP